jgi:hypothetical protein
MKKGMKNFWKVLVFTAIVGTGILMAIESVIGVEALFIAGVAVVFIVGAIVIPTIQFIKWWKEA